MILTMVPLSKVSFSAASLNSDHLFSKSALLFDKINLPFLSSKTTRKTSISEPISGIVSTYDNDAGVVEYYQTFEVEVIESKDA